MITQQKVSESLHFLTSFAKKKKKKKSLLKSGRLQNHILTQHRTRSRSSLSEKPMRPL